MRPPGVVAAGTGVRAGGGASAGPVAPVVAPAAPVASPAALAPLALKPAPAAPAPLGPKPAPTAPAPLVSALPPAAIMPATRLAIVPLCAGDTVQSLALAIAVADRLAALTARPGAIVTVDPAVARLVRNSGRRPRGLRLDGFSVLARRGNVSLIGVEDAGAAAIAVSARLPLVSLVAADESMSAALAEIRPGALLLVAGEQTGARYLELARDDLAARLPAARVLSASFGERDSGVPPELVLLADQSAAPRLRLGVRASRATRVSAELLAAHVLEGRG